ncbi:MAG TPA: ABC transporter ATP-binding protein [Streptosporangiaceae bacterium]|jgi:ATP-binding cassette subfamily B protein|nr:ABC transporter ATP-binding protein [Streptosporangiaceae bacterium]
MITSNGHKPGGPQSPLTGRPSIGKFKALQQPVGAPRSIRRLPGLVGRSVGLLWRAAPLLTVLILVLTLISGVSQGLAMLALRNVIVTVIDAGGGGLKLGVLAGPVLFFGGVVAAAAVSQLAMSLVQTLLVERVTYYSFERVLDVAAAADLGKFDDPKFHDQLTRAQNAGGRPYMITQSMLGIARSLSVMGSLLAVLFALQPLLVVPLLLMVVPLVTANTSVSKRVYRFSVEFNEHERRRYYLRSLLTARPSAAEVRAYGLIGHIRERNEALTEERENELRSIALRSLPKMAAGGLGAAVAIAGSVGLLMGLVMAGKVPLATAAVGSFTVFQLSGILAVVSMNVGQLFESSLFLDDYKDFLALLPGMQDRDERRDAEAPADFDAIRVDDVSFSYPNATTPALDGVSITLRRGEIVALVGENGSGKTTLAKILCQLYSPGKGTVFWGTTDLATVRPQSLWPRIAVVFQDFGRYLFTVAENIAIGRIERAGDRPAIEDAAAAAGVDDFATSLPEGYDTPLGKIFEHGADVSVGQWQRIALARAFFRDARLIILDEPTAALDPRAEYALFQSMRRLFAGRTVLLISHRFSTVRAADRIYVMEKGHVVESGTHEQLLADDGLYAELYGLQEATEISSGQPGAAGSLTAGR